MTKNHKATAMRGDFWLEIWETLILREWLRKIV